MLSEDETFARILAGESLQFKMARYRNAQGDTLSDDERKLLNAGLLSRRYFHDNNGKVIEVRCMPLLDGDEFYDIQLIEFLSGHPLNRIRQIDLDCDSTMIDSLYRKVMAIDQGMRTSSDFDYMPINSDVDNQVVVVSLIEQCGFPSKIDHVLSAWHVVQHSGHSGLMEYYYRQFAKAADDGLLDKISFATMQDRILMHHGRPQIYGIQMVGGARSSDGEINTLGQTFGFHAIRDPDNVNARRAAIGMMSIEAFAEKNNIDFRR